MERQAKRKSECAGKPAEYATLEEFRRAMAPIAGKALGEAVRSMKCCGNLQPITAHKKTA